MKMRLHLDRESDGLVILESEPQLRSLFIRSETHNSMRVPLPYIIFVVRYTKHSDNKFLYPGIYGSGLFVFGKSSSLADFSDEVFYLPTDRGRKGLVCTDHSSDFKGFDSVVELVNYVITLWWSLSHNIDYNPFDEPWRQVELKDVFDADWKVVKDFRKSLLEKRDYGMSIQRDIPMDANVLDVQWPTPLKTSPYGEDEGEDEAEAGYCRCESCCAIRLERRRRILAGLR